MTIMFAIFDVDGTLSPQTVTYCSDATVSRQFSVRDGLGMRMLIDSGVEVWMVSQEDDDSIRHRANKIVGNNRLLGIKDKREVFGYFSANMDEIAWMGDDLNDMECLRVVGLPACPADAIGSVRSLVMSRGGFVSNLPGGHGAAREFCEHILKTNAFL